MQEAADFFFQHPSVQPGGVGVIGISKGAELALHLGAYHSHVGYEPIRGGLLYFSQSELSYKSLAISLTLKYHLYLLPSSVSVM